MRASVVHYLNKSLPMLIGIKAFAVVLQKFHPCSLEDLFLLPLLSIPRSLTAKSIILAWVGAPLPNQIPHQLPGTCVDHSRGTCSNVSGDSH